MPYDPNLDEKMFSKSWETEFERITVSVFSYNNGAKKLQLNRENKDPQGEFRFAMSDFFSTNNGRSQDL